MNHHPCRSALVADSAPLKSNRYEGCGGWFGVNEGLCWLGSEWQPKVESPTLKWSALGFLQFNSMDTCVGLSTTKPHGS
jgi:hypothetical protein